jgi:type IV pilus assembly protein PilA
MKSKVGIKQRRQDGFTLVEMIIAVCIVAILGSIALAQMRDYTRRARISEVVMASNGCKTAISENYLVRDSTPNPGSWGCESPNSGTNYAGAVQTSSDGVIRVMIQNLDGLVNGRYVYLIPTRTDGAFMVTPNDLGTSVRGWTCGSDWQPVRNALPSNCHTDTTGVASQDYQ